MVVLPGFVLFRALPVCRGESGRCLGADTALNFRFRDAKEVAVRVTPLEGDDRLRTNVKRRAFRIPAGCSREGTRHSHLAEPKKKKKAFVMLSDPR